MPTTEALGNTHERAEVRARALSVDNDMQAFNKELVGGGMCFDMSAANVMTSLINLDGAAAIDAAAIQNRLLTDLSANVTSTVQREQRVGADQAAKEKAFYKEFALFLARWDYFYQSLQSFNLLGPSPDEAWNTIAKYETRLAKYKQDAATLLAAPTPAPSPSTPATPGAPNAPGTAPGATGPTLPGSGPSLSTSSPTTWLLLGGAAVGGYLLYRHLRKPAPNAGLSALPFSR